MTDKTPPRIGRREALALFGGAGAAALLPGAAASAVPAAAAASTCILTPEVTEGPYWIANHLTRRNITEGRPGLALRLRLTVVDATSCKTIKGADVELWHADATGVYSGFGCRLQPALPARPPARRPPRARHLRHDLPGLVSRPHAAHPPQGACQWVKVVHTGQLFFNDVTSDAVYRTATLQRPRPARHDQRAGHDLRAGRWFQGSAASGQAQRRLRGIDHGRRQALTPSVRDATAWQPSGRDSVAPSPARSPGHGPAIAQCRTPKS